jgi:LPXTG-motif cell wall-anchored protein
MRFTGKGRARALAAMTIVAGSLVIVSAQTADAATVNLTCDAFLYANGTYDPNAAPVQAGIAQELSLGDLAGPPEVNAGTSFNVSSPGTSRTLPNKQDSILGEVTVVEVKNVETQIQVTGAAAIGAVTLSGGNVLNPSVSKNGNVLTLTLPGSQNGSQIPAGGPAGNAFFPGGSNLSSPAMQIGLTAGAAGTTISAKIIRQDIDVIVDVPNIGKLSTHLICDPETNNLGTVQVVTPPPPGAPDAVADVATTEQDTDVTIAVLDNDTPDAQLPIDEDSLAIVSDPSHGSVVVNADHTVTYTPDAGFSGTDSFDYELCSAIDIIDTPRAAQEGAPCDIATVTITVNPEPTTPTTQGTTPTTPAPTPSTQAAGDADELPRTGSSSLPLGVTGFALCLLGAAALAFNRRRVATGS